MHVVGVATTSAVVAVPAAAVLSFVSLFSVLILEVSSAAEGLGWVGIPKGFIVHFFLAQIMIFFLCRRRRVVKKKCVPKNSQGQPKKQCHSMQCNYLCNFEISLTFYLF